VLTSSSKVFPTASSDEWKTKSLIARIDTSENLPHCERCAARQISEIEIDVAAAVLGLHHDELVQVAARVDRELTHEPVDVPKPIELTEDEVVADDDDDRPTVVEQLRPERRACDFPIGRLDRARRRIQKPIEHDAGNSAHNDEASDARGSSPVHRWLRRFPVRICPAGLRVAGHQHEPVFPFRNADRPLHVGTVPGVVLPQLLPQIVRIDPDHRVLARIEIAAAPKHFGRDLDLLRNMVTLDAVDQILEQRLVETRPPEHTARDDPVGLCPDRVDRLVLLVVSHGYLP
jgi:hypothetical protein